MRTLIRLSFVITLLVITVLPAGAIKDKALILYLSFDEAKGDTIEDLTGNKHNGTLRAKAEITKKEVKFGAGALQIEDQGAVMAVATFKEMEDYQDNTFVFWIYFTAGSNGSWSQIVVKKAPGSDRSPGVWINPGSTGIHYRYNPGNAGANAIGPKGEGSVYDLKTWYHIAGVKKGAELKVYVDGEERGKYGVPKDHSQGAGELNIGNSAAYRAATFIMDDFAIYNRALTDKEIKADMDNGVLPQAVEAQGKLATLWSRIKTDY